MGKKIIIVKLIERDGEDKVLDEYEIGSWDMPTEHTVLILLSSFLR